MAEIDDGGPAFPHMAANGMMAAAEILPGAYTAVPMVEPVNGLTKRDYFAAAALTGLLANSEAVHAGAEPTNSCLFTGKMFADYAGLAVKMADALIAASKSEVDHG